MRFPPERRILMRRNQPALKYVTEAVFIKETNNVHQKLDDVVFRVGKLETSVEKLETSVSRLAVSAVNAEHRFDRIEQTMLTKEDGQRILDRIDAFANETALVMRNEMVHRQLIHDGGLRMDDHEKRLRVLEGKS
jgi:hypothetical protein